MKAEDFPLFELYTRLQEAGLPLGLSEYAQVVKALQAGFGLPDQKALSWLCRAIWVKNEEEAQIFNYHFAEVIGVKHSSHAEVAKTNTQRSALYCEATFAQKLAAQTTRNGLIGIVVAFVLFCMALVGLRLIPSRPEDIVSNATPTEQEASAQPGTTEIDVSTPPTETTPQVSVVLLSSLIGSMIAGTGVSWLLIRRLKIVQNGSPIDETDDIITQTIVSRMELTEMSDDEVQLAETIGKAAESKNTTLNIKVLGQDEYFPLTRRQMKQGWRYLRRNLREGPKTEFDIGGTVNQIGHQGVFLEPLMQAPRGNRTDLVFLLDQDGSMAPFQALSKRLVDTAVRAGRLGSPGIYYFHNCPVGHIYQDPMMQESETLSHFLRGRLSSKSVIMIVSDAGAARGGFNPARVLKTKAFLAQINQYVRYVVWLNPLPRSRWEHTTAGEIANFVAMFEVNRAGFQSALDVLRGRWKPSVKTPQVAP